MNRLVACGIAVAACRAPAIPPATRFPAGTPFTARYVTIDATRIRYLDAGRGPPVVFLHGLGASMYAWRKNVGPVAAAHFRVIAFDNRGFGFSDRPATGYDNASYVRLVVGLLDSLRLPDAVLVGHSMGGVIASEVALAHPARVRGLVLIGSAGLGAPGPRVIRLGGWPVIGSLLVALRGRGVTERLLKSSYADPSKVSEADVDQYYAPVAGPDYGRALHGVLRAFRFDALQGRLDHLDAPTLVLWGEDDRWIPIQWGRALAAEIPRAAFLSVPHSGHAVQEEAPDEVNRLVIGFLETGLGRVAPDLALEWRSAYFLNQPVDGTGP